MSGIPLKLPESVKADLATHATAAAGQGTPQLTTETKFMQQYRIAAAAHGGGDIVALRNGRGQVEVFTVGTDGTVWNFYPDASSDTGYSSMSTGLAAKWVVAGLNAAGKIVLFAANNLVLNYVVETGQTGSSRWGPMMTAQLSQPSTAIAISGLYAQQIGGRLYVGALTKFKSASPGNSYALAYSLWDDNPGVFTSTTVNLSTLNCVWSGSASSTAEFTVLDTVYLGFNVSTQTVRRYPFAATFKSLAVTTSLDSSGNNRYFAILADGNLYQMVGTTTFSWAQITQGMGYRDVQSALSDAREIELFTLDTGGRLFHFQPSQATGKGWTDPMVIDSGVALMGVAQQNQGNLEVFTVGTAQATLSHLINQQQSGNWQITPLEVPTSGQVEEFISYSTDIMVYDAAGAPMPNAPIQVWAATQTQIVVNGASYTIDASTPANLTCASSGTLSITQGTGILGIPALQINVVSQMPAGQGIALEQYAGVQQRLAEVTGPDLMNAKTADGSYLLQEQYRTTEQTDSLAAAFNQCMALASNPLVARDTGHASLGAAPKRGVGCVASDATHLLNRIKAPAQGTHWQLDFRSGGPRYRELSHAEAHQLLLEKRASHVSHAIAGQSVGGVFDWIGSIGDFVSGVVDGIITVVDTIITTVGNAVNAAISFVVNGVTYLFEMVVDFIEQAFDLVEVFFAQVKVVFTQIFEWLGFIFSWSDILRTHEALSYTMAQFLGFLPGAVAGIQRLFDEGIATARSELATIFDQLVASVGGTASIGGYTNSQTPSEPVYSSGNANNLVLNATLENSSASSQVNSVAPPNASPWDILTQEIQAWTTSVQEDPAFAAALGYMQNLGGSPDQIFSQLLSALLRVVQGLANAMLAGVQAIVDGLLRLVQSFLSALQQEFTAEWNIPFVTQFYAWLTNGSALSLADLSSLILAIPSTIIYKAMYGAAPFPDQASVDQFKASFSAQTMLTNSGLAQGAKDGKKKAAIEAPAPVVPLSVEAQNSAQVLLGVSAAVSSFAYGFLSAAMDIKPTTGAGVVDPLVKVLTKFALGTEIYAQAAFCPWIYSSGGPNCSTADGAGKWVWIYTCLGVVLDCGFVMYEGAFPENDDTIPSLVVATLYGAGHVVVTGITFSELSGLARAANIVQCVPEVCKLLKLPAIETATSGVSLAVVAAADALCITAAGVISFADLLASSNASPQPVAGAVPALLG
jgi:hypothetical protein